jgi:hypothetical protein
MVLRRIACLTAVLLSFAAMSPVLADLPNSGLHLEHGNKSSAGCYDIELWSGDTLLKTFVSDGTPCDFSEWSAVLPNGRMVFDVVYPHGGFDGTRATEIWSSQGSLASTVQLQTPFGSDFRCQPTVAMRVVYRTAYMKPTCKGGGVGDTYGTRGTQRSTVDLLQSTGARFVRTGKRIVYGGTSTGLFTSNGTYRGTFMINNLSDIQKLRSDGTIATFTAYDGHAHSKWVTDGTAKGTHRLGPA